jgi:hypothetical protein
VAVGVRVLNYRTGLGLLITGYHRVRVRVRVRFIIPGVQIVLRNLSIDKNRLVWAMIDQILGLGINIINHSCVY